MKIDASLATVKALRAAGASVAILDLNEDSGNAAAADTGAVFCQCDVLSDESVDQAFAKARAAQGQETAPVSAAATRSRRCGATSKPARSACFRPTSSNGCCA